MIGVIHHDISITFNCIGTLAESFGFNALGENHFMYVTFIVMIVLNIAIISHGKISSSHFSFYPQNTGSGISSGPEVF